MVDGAASVAVRADDIFYHNAFLNESFGGRLGRFTCGPPGIAIAGGAVANDGSPFFRRVLNTSPAATSKRFQIGIK